LCTVFLTHAVFSGLAKIWACTGLGKYTVHCLSVRKIWSSSTVVTETHAAQQMAHIQLRTSTCWQPTALQLWDSEPPPSGPVQKDSPYSALSLSCDVMLSVLATHTVYCSTQVSANQPTESNMQLSSMLPQHCCTWISVLHAS